MTKKITHTKYNRFMSIGFILFFMGIFLTTVLKEERVFQIAGIILLIASSAFFGAAISAKPFPKK